MKHEQLFEYTQLGPIALQNRIMSSGHQTTLVHDYLPTEGFFAYHLARARGGTGLVVLEAHAVHESGLLTDHTIDASRDAIVEKYAPFVQEMHAEDTRMVAQLFHGGRERYAGEYAPPSPSSSDKPTDRLHVIPRPMETSEVYEMIKAYVQAAERMEAAGLDGVEVVGSHNYLPAQFWSPKVNDRDDEFGGNIESRCRFTTEVISRIRDRTDDGFGVGLRLSAEEKSEQGLTFDEMLPIVEQIDGESAPDYWSIVVGSSSTQQGCSYIVPPATESETVTRSPGAVINETVDAPIIVTSRINTPQKACRMVEETGAAVVGMTRALIADPELPTKTKSGDEQSILPCVACNQGCIGRYQEGLPIRCTVNPVTGREATFEELPNAESERSVLVVGGGPAGLVAASTAAERGHNVTLVEATASLGGKVSAYGGLEHRGRYEEWIAYLSRQLDENGVTVELNTAFTPEDCKQYDPDAVVLATGATGRIPEIPIAEGMQTYSAVEALSKEDTFTEGERVIISDWEGSEAALDMAAEAASAGADVEVVTTAYSPGESVQQYILNQLLGKLYEAGVTFTPHHRVNAVGEDTVDIKNVFNDDMDQRSGQDTVVFSHRGEADYETYRVIAERDLEVQRVGDCWAPRSLDEAVWEGFKTATEL